MSELLIETPSDHVHLLKLNRPERRNAISTSLLRQIAGALDDAASNPDVLCVVITGNDKAFAAGADIDEVAQKDMIGALDDIRPGLWSSIRGFQKPLVAAVEGWCLGAGCELAMCCDIVVAGVSAQFGQPETNLGIMPGAGGTATLPRLVGRATAMKMILLGEPISAYEACNAGLIASVAETGRALIEALDIAKKLSGRAPLALRQAKASVKAAFDLPHGTHLDLERQYFASLFATHDKREGTTAFLERRPPIWTGS